MRKLLYTFCVIFSVALQAKTGIDLYGDEENRARIVKKYGKSILALEDAFHKIVRDEQLNKTGSKPFNDILFKKLALVNQIKNEYGYAYVDFDTVNYAVDTNYTTIEVIRKEDVNRLKLINDDDHAKAQGIKDDLIGKMIAYEELGFKLFFNGHVTSKEPPCPVYHCVWGFEHPQLKPFYPIFQQGVKKQKQLILDTLNTDPDPNRRAAAAFLVGHFSNPNDIIDVLVPHVLDKNDALRNNVIRVIGVTLEKYNAPNLNIDPFLQLLASPYETDRNKSLMVLLQVCDSHQQQLIHEGKKPLLALLALKQPNNHDFAYEILKKISGKNYSDTDIQSWNAWFDSV